MNTTLRTFFLCLIWAGIIIMQNNFDMDSTATRRIKDALELAVHDAGLAIDKAQLQDGSFVFDQIKAEANLRRSLEENLSLNSSLVPLTGSFLQTKLEIVSLEYFDSNNTTQFPFNYSNSSYDLLVTIDGPAIVVIVETTSPRYFDGTPITIRQGAVYEYQDF